MSRKTETTDVALSYEQAARSVVETLDAEQAGKLKRGLSRLNVTLDQHLARARPSPVHTFALLRWEGRTCTMAARGAGLDLSRDWGRISAERARDPVLHAMLTSAERAQRDRIATKAAQVAESALDGEQVTREAARLAALLLKDDGTSAARVAPGTAPQVVINITDGASFNLARDNLLQGGAGNVIDM